MVREERQAALQEEIQDIYISIEQSAYAYMYVSLWIVYMSMNKVSVFM